MNDSHRAPIRVTAVVDRQKLDGVAVLLAVPHEALQVNGNYQVAMLTPLAALDLIEQLRSAIDQLHSIRSDAPNPGPAPAGRASSS